MDFDIVLNDMGGFGRYQAFLVLAALWSMIPIGCNISGVVFLAYTESTRCFLPTIDGTSGNKTAYDDIIAMVPLDVTGQKFSSCTQFVNNTKDCLRNNYTNCSLNVTMDNTTSQAISGCTNGYVHERAVFDETISSEWDLVCDRSSLTSLSTSLFCLGMLIGSLIGGSIADRYGRMPTMVSGTVFNIAIAVGCSFSPNFVVFAALRFFIGAVSVTIQIAMTVYSVEIIGKRWRAWVGLQVGVFSGLGYMLLSVLAFTFRHWRVLQLTLGLIFIPFLVFAPFMPESPRYLFSKGKMVKAKEVCRLIARRNGRKLNEDIWEKASTSNNNNTKPEMKKRNLSPTVLCRGLHIPLLLLRMVELWFTNSLVFFYLAFNAGNWSGNPFLNNCFSGLAESVACLLVVPVITKFGRRFTVMFCLTLAGVFMLVAEGLKSSFPLSQDWSSVVLLLVAKFTVSASFNLMFLYTSEMFPTTVRNTALGVTSTGGRFASIIAPFLIQLKLSKQWIIPVGLGFLSIGSAVLAYWCPETRKVAMLATMNEAKTFYTSQRRRSSRLKSISSFNNNSRADSTPAIKDSSPMLDEETKI